eukprot:TRINITY_DN64016_c0_g1_i1.p1 TRINITY_DN64016_c0_g1~~TRINITY_DN64016_c0_g1_i1.p1  ORF type:complete len:473 (+),score=124.23 TRINITY_DN64016_c0_g1_i1:80-1498(+)
MGNLSGGFCKACLNDLGETSLETPVKPSKVKPLLCDLKADFEKFSGDDGKLQVSELATIWKEAALKKVGKLSDEDTAVIDECAKAFMSSVDTDKNGTVSYEEFALYMLGSGEAEGNHLKHFRSQVNEKLAQDPEKMKELIDQFTAWDKNGDGFITQEELETHLLEMNALAQEDGVVSKSEAEAIEKVTKLKDEIFANCDRDADGKVDIWEVMAYALGRKKTPVEILLYDISGGCAAKYGMLLTGKRIEAVHSGVLVFNSEYWYGGKVFRSEPPCTKCFGQPLARPWDIQLGKSEVRPDLPVVKVGYTFCTHAEFAQWLTKNVVKRYTGLEQYDLLTHSCNHFSNEIVTFLTGKPIPDKILELQRTALTPQIRAILPFINRHLGGFADATKEIDENYFAKDSDPDGGEDGAQADGDLKTGDVVLWEGVDGEGTQAVATVMEANEKAVKLRYFCPAEGAMVEHEGVPKKKVKKI